MNPLRSLEMRHKQKLVQTQIDRASELVVRNIVNGEPNNLSIETFIGRKPNALGYGSFQRMVGATVAHKLLERGLGDLEFDFEATDKASKCRQQIGYNPPIDFYNPAGHTIVFCRIAELAPVVSISPALPGEQLPLAA